jgi:hypothetical protein
LVLTDITTGWTECLALPVRDHLLVVEGFVKVESDLLFALRGVDTDNDSQKNSLVRGKRSVVGLPHKRAFARLRLEFEFVDGNAAHLYRVDGDSSCGTY